MYSVFYVKCIFFHKRAYHDFCLDIMVDTKVLNKNIFTFSW